VDQQDKTFVTIISAVLGLLVLVTIVIFILAHLVVDDHSGEQDAFRAERAAQQLVKPGHVVIAGTPAAEQEQAQLAGGGTAPAAETELGGVQLYQQVCASCHAQGLLNSPKPGDTAAWEPRYQQGLDTLVQHAVGGFNQMPPQGQAPGATEDNIKAAVVYMLEQSGIELAATDAAPAETEQAAAEPAAEAAPAATEQAAPVAASAGATAPAATAPAEAAATPAGLVLPDSLDLTQGQQVYDTVCRFCHLGNIPSAPKFGDKEAWAPRAAQGWDTLKGHVLNGFKGMPAKGGRTDMSDEQILNALGYMLSNAQ